MRISKEKAAENHVTILNQAARLFREGGIAGVGVDAVAKAAQLTHGSLYSQFGSKDKVLAETLAYSLEQRQGVATGPTNLANAVTAYLSPQHRDNPGTGCFLATLGCEMPRQSAEVRTNFTQMVKGNVQRLVALMSGIRGRRQREDEALAAISTMVGSMVLARAVNDAALSDRILSAGRAHLLATQGKKP